MAELHAQHKEEIIELHVQHKVEITEVIADAKRQLEAQHKE